MILIFDRMINEKELLALSDNEKLAIIDFLQSNLFDSSYQVTDEQQNIVAERLEKMEKGDSQFYTLEQFRKQLIKRRS